MATAANLLQPLLLRGYSGYSKGLGLATVATGWLRAGYGECICRRVEGAKPHPLQLAECLAGTIGGGANLSRRALAGLANCDLFAWAIV